MVTVGDLIKQLNRFDHNLEIKVYDPGLYCDGQWIEPTQEEIEGFVGFDTKRKHVLVGL